MQLAPRHYGAELGAKRSKSYLQMVSTYPGGLEFPFFPDYSVAEDPRS